MNKTKNRLQYVLALIGVASVDWPVFRELRTSIFQGTVMKIGIHPEYKKVVFQDISSDFAILTRSTINSKETIKWEDGNEYPLVKVEVSSASHPFYTGKHKMLDSVAAWIDQEALRQVGISVSLKRKHFSIIKARADVFSTGFFGTLLDHYFR